MKKLLSLLAIICSLGANAQTIIISFAGTGESFSVSSVIVENLTSASSAIITSGKLLRLNVLTDVNTIENKQLSELKIYPNPMTDNAVIQVKPPVAGMATITVSDLNGKQIAQSRSYLESYLQEFCVSGIKSGLYIVTVKGRTFQYSGKLLSEGKSTGGIKINKVSSKLMATAEEKSTKGSRSEPGYVDMDFTTGDRLKFTGVSGNYSTVITDIPVSDKTITFNFITCKDGEDNSYPVVQIGTQLWMAENLKTTKYNDETTIDNVTVNTDWMFLYSGAYCWYNNNEATYKTSYGALYNWYSVNSGKLCPTGWHVPSDDEWQQLVVYLVDSTGIRLKETGTTHWLSPNSAVTNETGFTALPGGLRQVSGPFSDIQGVGYWWSSTEIPTQCAQSWFMTCTDPYIFKYGHYKQYGYSVRCIKDN